MDRFALAQTFIAVVDAGSLSSAAETVGTAKSVISKRSAELESHLGVKLLHRSARRMELTDCGARYYASSCRILSDLQDADEAVASSHADLSGVLRVAAPMSFGTLHLQPLVVKLMRRHPDLMIELDLNDRVIALQNERFDLAVRLGQLPDSSLIARVIAPNRHVICASPEYLERRGIPETPDALRHHDGLLYSAREPHGMWRLLQNGEISSWRIGTRMRCNNGEMLQAAAVGGLGLAILPTFMAAPHLASGALKVVLPDVVLPGGSIAAVYARDRCLPIRVRVLIEALVAAFGPVAPWDIQPPPS